MKISLADGENVAFFFFSFYALFWIFMNIIVNGVKLKKDRWDVIFQTMFMEKTGVNIYEYDDKWSRI